MVKKMEANVDIVKVEGVETELQLVDIQKKEDKYEK